eukprot:CAMPEP_0182491764 /NCGR_PEP_ID=MMETSP1321-20130603/1078_1 /TAXON_ID=91990 /ORGANISM="Bolidomonas sp., Strain RCC1657" /LENGTH=241 /DNA_ID=CAMNT_0024694087 /DNA_START=131 /DNA_END=856 /DNA_ORIENTATION=+
MISLTQIQATPPSPPNEPIVACKGRNLGTRANLAVNIVEGATTCAEVERIGSGDVVKVAFKAMRFDTCEVFDATALDEHFVFQVGRGDVLEGFEKGLLNGCAGQVRRMTVPSHLGFGEEDMVIEGLGFSIPGGTSLIYEVTIVEVEQSELPQALEEIDEEVQAKIDRADKMEKEHHFKVTSPRTSKHRVHNMKTSNHELSRKGLESHKEKIAERKLRKEVERRRRMGEEKRMGSDGGAQDL